MTPSLLEVLDTAVPFEVPLRVPFRGVTRRVGLLLRGPAGWGEFAPFDNYAPRMAARWLSAALEAAWVGWPAPVRDSVAVNLIVPALPAPAVAKLLADAAGATVKVKVTGDLPADRERVAAVRDLVGPAARIRLDVNAAWTLADALQQLPVLAQAAGGLEYVEQPLASLAEMAQLRCETGIAVAVDETLRLATDPFDPAMLAAVRDAADVAVLKVAPLGGVGNVLTLARRLAMPVVVSSAMDTAVGLSAGIAAACALPHPPLACGLGTGALLAADVIDPPLVPVDGRLSPVHPTPRTDLVVGKQDAARMVQRLTEAWEYL